MLLDGANNGIVDCNPPVSQNPQLFFHGTETEIEAFDLNHDNIKT